MWYSKNKKAFTIIELIVIIAIIAILVLLAIPKFMNYTREAEFTRLTYDARLLENACEQYYLDHGDWPRASDTPYTAEQVNTFAQKVYDQTSKVIVLDPEGKYYDIDMQKLGKYVTINSDPRNFVLQNPVGSVYILDPQTNTKLINNAPIAVITMTPDENITTETVINWSYTGSTDPDNDKIVNAEWEGKQDVYTSPGTYTVRLRVQDEHGEWSNWVTKTFTVTQELWNVVANMDILPSMEKDPWLLSSATAKVADGILTLGTYSSNYYFKPIDATTVNAPKIVFEAKVKVASDVSGYYQAIMTIEGDNNRATVSFLPNGLWYERSWYLDFVKVCDVDMTTWHIVRLVKRNKVFDIYLDGQMVATNINCSNIGCSRIAFGDGITGQVGYSYWDYVRYRIEK